jgi:hypothetical protein
MELYLIRAQSGEFLDRHLEWVAAPDPVTLFQTPHRDVALNQLVELNARDIRLRATVLPCNRDAKGRPDLESLVAGTAC